MPEQYRKLLVDTVKERDLKLLEVLKSSDELSYQQRLAVMEYLADVLPDQLVGPEHEPTEGRRLIEHTIDAFLERWPLEHPKTKGTE